MGQSCTATSASGSSSDFLWRKETPSGCRVFLLFRSFCGYSSARNLDHLPSARKRSADRSWPHSSNTNVDAYFVFVSHIKFHSFTRHFKVQIQQVHFNISILSVFQVEPGSLPPWGRWGRWRRRLRPPPCGTQPSGCGRGSTLRGTSGWTCTRAASLYGMKTRTSGTIRHAQIQAQLVKYRKVNFLSFQRTCPSRQILSVGHHKEVTNFPPRGFFASPDFCSHMTSGFHSHNCF